MNEFIKKFSQLPYSHHAYGIISSDIIGQKILNSLSHKDFSYIFHKKYDSFKIDDARTIKSLQSEKTSNYSLFILEFGFMNSEAQNTLLKTLEEPTSNTYFILISPSLEKLLPTLLSRLQILNYTSEKNTNVDSLLSLENFVHKNLQERLNLIKKITDKKKEHSITKSEILFFLDSLEGYVLENKKNIPTSTRLSESIFNARSYLHAKGASSKMILEMLALDIEH